jgi:peptidoglycan hydrolase CwlO-like protein
MKKSKDYLNIDLEFLDKKDPPRTVPKKKSSPEKSTDKPTSTPNGYKYKWVVILIIWYTIFFFIGQENSDNSGNLKQNSSYTTQDTSEDTVRNGQYRCSSYHSNQADLLNPDESEEQVTFAQNSLEQRSNELDRLKNEIDNSYVNESSSQYEIDDYNEKIDSYNAKLASYKRDANNMSSRVGKYNEQIQRHNNYLITNCTKAY